MKYTRKNKNKKKNLKHYKKKSRARKIPFQKRHTKIKRKKSQKK